MPSPRSHGRGAGDHSGLQTPKSGYLVINACGVLMLLIGLQARSNAFFGERASRTRCRIGAIVLVFQERDPGRRRGSEIRLARRSGADAAAVAASATEHWRDRSNVIGIQSIIAIAPVLPPNELIARLSFIWS